MPVCNACILDFLLKHPRLFPDSWKGHKIIFWGTIFKHTRGGDLIMLSLSWQGPNCVSLGWSHLSTVNEDEYGIAIHI